MSLLQICFAKAGQHQAL